MLEITRAGTKVSFTVEGQNRRRPQSVRQHVQAMASAARFWPSNLLRFGRKPDIDAVFVPTTPIAARIVGKPLADEGASAAYGASLDAGERPAPDDAGSPANDAEAARQADRFVPVRSSTVLTDHRGKGVRARIINISATGVAIEADFRLMAPETVAMVGSKTVTPGRAIRGGHVFLFEKPLDLARCNPQIVL
jgi:hypothetical protein